MNKHIQHTSITKFTQWVGKVSTQPMKWLLLFSFFLVGTQLELNAQADCCKTNSGKPRKLTILYNGLGCSSTQTSQAPGKYTCQDVGGGPIGLASVYIVASSSAGGSGKVYFSGTVNLNSTFVVSSQNGGDATFPSNTYFTIYTSQGGAIRQNLQIHTSCSTPIVMGDQLGTLKLLAAEWPTGSVCGTPTPPETCPTPTINVTLPAGSNNSTVCAGDQVTYSTTNLGFPCLTYLWNFGSGATPATATGLGPHTVTYSTTGTKTVTLAIDNDCEGGTGTTVCLSTSSGGGGGTVGGSDCCNQGDKPKSLTLRYNGQSCANTNTVQSTSKYSCTDLSGGPNGDPNVYIIAAEKENGTGKIYFTGNVAINTNFTAAAANAGASEFPSNTYFLIYNQQGGSLRQLVKIHTSCSAPIIPGDQFGSLVLQSVVFKNNFTCGPVTPPGPNCIDCDVTATKTITVQTCQPVVGKIGDFVWDDVNGNGVQNPGEPGIPSAFVMLMTCQGAFVSSTFTDATGMYMFSNLPAGSYRVFFSNPNGSVFMPTLKDQGNDDTKDSDAGNDGWTDCITLNQGQTNLTIDAGFKRLGPPPCTINLAVSNIVCDGKGTSSTADDTYTFTFTVTGTNTSGAWQGGYNNAYLGAFAFAPTPYGTPITLGPFPAGQFTPGNVFPPITFQNGVDISLSVSDVGFPSCATSTTVVSPGPCSPSATASLGDFVWNDLNQNGRQDAGEPGVSGVTVRLFRCDNTFVSQTTTNASGIYAFTNLAPNNQYYVEFSNLPSGFIFTLPDAVADNIDSDANQNNGRTNCVFLAPGDNNTTVDAGIYQPAPVLGSIGDFVWNDLNKNGIQENGEPGVPNVTVRLLNCAGAVLQVTNTNAAGNYLFSNLPAGSYIVEFSNLPAGFQFSPKGVGNNNTDSDANTTNGRTDCFNLATGQNDLSRDAGINQTTPPQPASVGDFVWNDLNKNGVQDPGEPGIQGVVVKLFTCANVFVAQFTTGANGFYQFGNLQPGSYFVQFSNLPSGFQFTTKDAGANANDATDSDVNPATGNTDCFSLVSGQNDPTRDAGAFQSTVTGPAKIGDFVWFDTNGNGVQNPGEPGIPNVFVILETCTGAYVNFATTDNNGMYMFNNVQPGQYRVKFASPGTYNGVPVQFTLKDAGNDDSKDSDADWLGFTACFTVNPGDINLTIDAGLKGETPPPVCVINGSVSNIVCNNKGTPNNPNDDTYTFTLVVNGTNTGDWGYDIPALGLFMLAYGQPYNLGPFNISAGALTLLLNDHDVADCTTTVTVQPPAPCSTGGGTPCTATAGTLTATQSTVTLQGGSAVISANHGAQPFVPSGFQKIYVLTKGAGLVIQATNSTPSFTVTSTGNYTIHTLVYNPATLNLGIVVPGVTTGFDVNALLIQGGGSICGALDVAGAPITVNASTGGCNITFTPGPGSITISGLNSPNISVKVFNQNWQTVFTCNSGCSNPLLVSGLQPGTYYVDVQMWNANWQPTCKKADYVVVSSQMMAPNSDPNAAVAVGTDKQVNTIGSTNAAQVEIPTPAGLNDLKLYPNPAGSYVMLEWAGAEVNQKAEISLFNQLGQLVKSIRIDDASTGNFNLDLNGLRSGQYIVHFRLDDMIPVVKKLTISY